MSSSRRIVIPVLPFVAGLVFALPAAAQAPADRVIVLATTTSVRDARLLEALLPPFERAGGYQVKVIAVGSGQAMALGRWGEADLVITHDPTGEERFMQEGYGVARVPLMSNEFVVVGPPGDPAGVRGAAGAVEAFRRIAVRGALFVSRADRSGTHVRERAVWERAGVAPARAWYRESGQGMSATLQIASELGAYALSDIATFMSHRGPLDLEVLVAGDSLLHNPYHILLPDPARFPWRNGAGARALLEHLVAPETQAAIGAFGRESLGRPLFVPADRAESNFPP